MVANKQDPNLPTNRGWTPLLLAARFGHFEIIKNLVKFVENPNEPCQLGRTPISYAAANGHLEIVQFLVNCTVNPNVPDIDGRTPIHKLAARTPIPKMADDVRNHPIATANQKYLEILKILIANTEKPNIADNKGWTPIHAAAVKGNTDVVKILVEYAETPNAEDDDWQTPLQLAKRLGHNEIVKILQKNSVLRV